MFKFLVSVGDWAGKFGLPFLLSGEIIYACIRRNYVCMYWKKLCMPAPEELCMSV